MRSLTSFRKPSFALVLIAVSTRAMFLRTSLILASFEAAPPVTCATRSCGRREGRGGVCARVRVRVRVRRARRAAREGAHAVAAARPPARRHAPAPAPS